MTNPYAAMQQQMKKKQEEAKKRAEAGVRTEASTSDSPMIRFGEYTTWPPFDVDMQAAVRPNQEGKAASEFRVVRLLSSLGMAYIHGISQKPPGTDKVLAPRYRNYPQYSDFECTLKADAGPAWEGYVPSPDWKKDGDTHYLSNAHDHVVGIGCSRRADGMNLVTVYTVNAEGLPLYASDRNLADWDLQLVHDSGAYGNEEDAHRAAKWTAERLMAIGMSCVFCAENDAQAKVQVPFNKRDPGGRQRILLQACLDMTWMELVQGKDREYRGQVQKTWRINTAGDIRLSVVSNPPKGVYVRGAKGRIQLSLDGGNRNQTLQKLWAYYSKLQTCCKACIPNTGIKKNSKSHVITYERLCCEKCGETLNADWKSQLNGEETIKRVPMNALFFERQPDALSDKLASVFHVCDACGHEGSAVPVMSCNTCSNPTPTQPQDVLTEIVPVVLSNGRYLDFRLHDPSPDPEVMVRTHYSEEYWATMPTVSVSGVAVTNVEGWPSNVKDASDRHTTPNKYDSLISLTVAEQSRLLDGSIIKAHN